MSEDGMTGAREPPSPLPRPAAKESFSSLDTLALARELRALGKAWFDKAFELPGEQLLLTLRVQGQGKWELRIAPGKFGFLRPASGERPDEPGRLGSELRRLLTGAPLLGVDQPSGERLLELSFGRGGEEVPSLLALELFGQGNVLAVRAGKIAAVLHVKAWAGRKLRPGEPYVRPPARKDPFEMSPGEVLAILLRSKNDRVSTLAARLGLGGPLAEEVLSRAGLEFRSPGPEVAPEAAERIVRALAELKADVAQLPLGYLYTVPGEAGELPLDASPYPSRRWKERGGATERSLPRFSDAAAVLFQSLAPAPPKPADTAARAVEEKRRARVQELERLQAQQSAQVQLLGDQKAEAQASADLLLQHFEEAERLFAAARAENPGDAEVDILLEGRTITLPARKGLREGAQGIYEEGKRLRERKEGAERALAETEKALAAARELAAAPTGMAALSEAAVDARERRGEVPRKKHFWFEKAPRWFVSSEGWPAVGGRDARSNDAIVKRYLKERDIYIHADFPGAPSVVLKSPPPGQGDIGPVTIREACQWEVSCSKAWRGGLASADAFWVAGDQVSKAGASGEFVARGSWMVHGTKRYERDLPLELDIGTLVYQGETLLQSGPPSAFAGKGSRILWKITPGNEAEREAVEREIAQDLGITRERVQSLLPPGGVSARRT